MQRRTLGDISEITPGRMSEGKPEKKKNSWENTRKRNLWTSTDGRIPRGFSEGSQKEQQKKSWEELLMHFLKEFEEETHVGSEEELQMKLIEESLKELIVFA